MLGSRAVAVLSLMASLQIDRILRPERAFSSRHDSVKPSQTRTLRYAVNI